MSDLHLEMREEGHYLPVRFERECDVLVLAGDILEYKMLADFPPAKYYYEPPHPMAGEFVSYRAERAFLIRRFLSDLASKVPQVVLVHGNHEVYASTIEDVREGMQAEMTAIAPNIHFLQNRMIELDGVQFVGTTLWADFDRSPSVMWMYDCMITDCKQIRLRDKGYRKWSAQAAFGEFLKAHAFLKHTLPKMTLPTVVVSHHGCTMKSIAPQYASSLDAAYASKLEDLMLDNPLVKHWVHGHTHHRDEYEVGDSMVHINAIGYPGEFTDTEMLVKVFDV